MKKRLPLLRVFFWGMLISYLGSLPLGTMNVMAAQLSVGQGAGEAFIFSFGSAAVELFYVGIILGLMKGLLRHQKVFRAMELLTCFVVLLLAVSCMVAAVRMTGFKSPVPAGAVDPLVSGMLLSALNPLHFVFWTGWSTVLINKDVLRPGWYNHCCYLAGIGFGTIAGFACFIYGGNYLISRLKDEEHIVNWVVGFILLITAVIQFHKFISKTYKDGKIVIAGKAGSQAGERK